MQLYLAGADSAGDHVIMDGLPNLAFLVSYWYIKNGRGESVVDYSISHNVPLFLDSGAFSAMTQGVEIDINEYTEYCLQHAGKFAVIASLDVIGDHVTTARNHDYMRSRGVNSIPTFHVNAPFSELDRLCSENSYVALGVAGMQKRRSHLMAWLTKCFRVNGGRARFHGFALTSPIVMYSFPWFSVDSSTWLGGRRFGVIIVRNGSTFSSYGRERWEEIENKVPPYVFVPRLTTRNGYISLLRWNASQMINWAKDYK